MAKTNVQWYPVTGLYCFYRLIDGELWYCPMRRDGSRASEASAGTVQELYGEALSRHPMLSHRIAEVKRDLNAKH